VEDFLSWMELSLLGSFVRESGPWTYPIVNLLHILGIASLFGAIVVMDFRLLGLWKEMPLAPLTRATVPLAVAGFGVAATTGAGLLSANATEYAGNPFLLIKFTAIPLALLNAIVTSRLPAWRARGTRELSLREQRQLALMGGISFTCWLTAIVAGRMIAYW
jgi:hypothetical protein